MARIPRRDYAALYGPTTGDSIRLGDTSLVAVVVFFVNRSSISFLLNKHLAVTLGQAKSNRVIIAAAAIMILVFGSFLFGGHRLLQEFGFGLAFSVLVDALVIRSLLLPAVMHLIGPANWALPNWLGRVLPHLSIEPGHGDPEPRIGDGIGAVGTT